MPRGREKSGRLRKIFVRTPGAKTVVHYRERKPGKAQCSGCGKNLAGVPRGGAGVISKYPKSARRPERPYGGKLCSYCARQLFKSKARSRA